MIEISALDNTLLWLKILFCVAVIAGIGILMWIAWEKWKS